MQPSKDYLEHRKRLRERFAKSGLEGFQDYEIVELLLSLGIPRSDTKPQAKEALRRFKTLRGVLEADPEQLQEIKGIGPYTVFVISFTQALAREFLKGKSLEMPTWNSSQEIFEYFYYSMRDLKKEIIKAVFLNSQNGVIEIKDISEGTVDSAQVYPREVIERAIRCGAVGLVLVHNHPSGLPQPSQSDKELTRNLVFAGLTMQIKVLDHLIIGDNRYYSLAGEGLIARCEDEFNSLKKQY